MPERYAWSARGRRPVDRFFGAHHAGSRVVAPVRAERSCGRVRKTAPRRSAPPQVGAPEVGADQVGVAHVGAAQVGADEQRAAQVRAAQAGAAEARAGEVGAAPVGPPPAGRRAGQAARPAQDGVDRRAVRVAARPAAGPARRLERSASRPGRGRSSWTAPARGSSSTSLEVPEQLVQAADDVERGEQLAGLAVRPASPGRRTSPARPAGRRRSSRSRAPREAGRRDRSWIPHRSSAPQVGARLAGGLVDREVRGGGEGGRDAADAHAARAVAEKPGAVRRHSLTVASLSAGIGVAQRVRADSARSGSPPRTGATNAPTIAGSSADRPRRPAPLGFAVRNRLAAFLGYVAADGVVNLVMNAAGLGLVYLGRVAGGQPAPRAAGGRRHLDPVAGLRRRPPSGGAQG